MELLVVLVVLVIGGGILIAALAVPLAIGSLSRDEKARAAAEANGEAILGTAFDGRDGVVFEVTPRSLPYGTVILGATQRGYTLLSETTDSPSGDRKTLVFTRAASRP